MKFWPKVVFGLLVIAIAVGLIVMSSGPIPVNESLDREIAARRLCESEVVKQFAPRPAKASVIPFHRVRNRDGFKMRVDVYTVNLMNVPITYQANCTVLDENGKSKQPTVLFENLNRVMQSDRESR